MTRTPSQDDSFHNLSRPSSNEARNDLFKTLSEALLSSSPSTTDEAEASNHTVRKVEDDPPKKQSSISSRISSKFRRKPKVKQNCDKRGRPVKAQGSSNDCHLANVLRSASRCLRALHEARESLSELVAEDELLARGIRNTNPTEAHKQLAHVALNITNLCREAFIPAHRLNQTAIALYCAEDFLRYPNDVRTFDLHANRGRIKLPEMSFNNATVMKLRQVVDLAADTYNKFSGRGPKSNVLREVLFAILRGCQDFYAATLGCQEIFKVLLYIGSKNKTHLQQFLLSLSAMDRSDLLGEIQELRRILDEIVIFFEKLSWGSFVIYRLSGGNAGDENLSTTNGTNTSTGSGKAPSSALSYPAYPLLKPRVPKLKVVTSKESKLTDSSDGGKAAAKSSFVSLEPVGKSKVGMKKSKFSKRKNMNVTTEEKLAPAGDANHANVDKNISKPNTELEHSK